MPFTKAQSLPMMELPKIIIDPTPARAGEGQCDCACVATVPLQTASQGLPHHASYTLATPFQTIPLTPEYEAVIGQRTNPILLNPSALALAQSFQQPHPLQQALQTWAPIWGESTTQTTLENMIALGLLVPEGETCPPFTEQATTLSAWFHITDRCNLRCAYCYLPHEPKDMSVEIGRAAISATFRSAFLHQYPQVKLKYAGGEPLLRFPVVLELHQYAQSVAQQFGLHLDGVVLSNSTLLTREIVETMQKSGLRLMISLDGLGDLHDAQRFYADGRGTFQDVARGVELALQLGLVPDISVTVSGRNAHGLPALISWILEHDLPFSLNFYRENEFSFSNADLNLEEDQIINGMLAAFKVIENHLPCRSLLPSLVDRANLSTPHLRTCGVGHSYMVFDHRGEISKCQMQRLKPVTSIHAQDPLELIRADQLGLQNLSVNEKEGCKDCEWKYWCTGGCSLATYRATGRYDVKSPNCNIYKTIYPQAVRLEGLRLIKVSSEMG